MMEVTLPWPPKALSPNARTHWRQRAPVARKYRDACRVLAKVAGFHPLSLPPEGVIHVLLDFIPPDRRSRDDDNLIAAFKSGRDGLADALNVDDKRFRIHPTVRHGEVGGMVKVRICETAPTYDGNEWTAE